MTAIIIICIIAAVIALILLCPVGVRIEYNSIDDDEGGALRVRLLIGFIAVTLVPKREKPIRLKDYSPKALRRKRLAAKAAEEKEKSKKSKKKKSAKSAESTGKAKKKPAKKKRSVKDIAALIRFYLRVAKILLARFGSALRIKVHNFSAVIASDDAAKTALIYGYASGTASLLFELLNDHANISYSRSCVCNIGCDFMSEKMLADIDVAFTIRIGSVFGMGFAALKLFLNKKQA